MNPITVFAVGLGAFLLWYAFTGKSIPTLIKSVIPAAQPDKK